MSADYLANVVGLPVQTTIRVIKNGSMVLVFEHQPLTGMILWKLIFANVDHIWT